MICLCWWVVPFYHGSNHHLGEYASSFFQTPPRFLPFMPFMPSFFLGKKKLLRKWKWFKSICPSWWPVHPWKLTCPQKRDYLNRKYIFQPLIFRGHVSFRGSSDKNMMLVWPGYQATIILKLPRLWRTYLLLWAPLDVDLCLWFLGLSKHREGGWGAAQGVLKGNRWRLDWWGSPTARVWKNPFDSTTTKAEEFGAFRGCLCRNLMNLGKIHLKRVKSWDWSMPNFSGGCSKVSEVYQKLPNSGRISAYLKSLPTSSKKWIYHRAPKLMPKHSRYFSGFLKQLLRYDLDTFV